MYETEIEKEKIIDKQKLIINKNNLTTIIGSNQSGKTTLAKKLNKKIENSILISDNKILEFSLNEKYLKKIEYEYLIDSNCEYLSTGEKQIYNLISGLSSKYEVLILDDALSSIDNITKENIFKLLKKELKNKTIINITSDVEESLYGTYIMILNSGKIVINEKTRIALTKEQEFRKYNLDLPFMASLSLKLKYYNLLDNLYLDKNKMVDKLWK